MTKIYHGGALDEAIKLYGGTANEWLDLSTGINPYHYPIDNVSVNSWTQLPQNSALDGLLLSASAAYNCAVQNIMAANGTQILIENLPKIFDKSTVAILSPTYEEHAHNWRKLGHNVILTDDITIAKTADHLIMVNPNNPDGKLYSTPETKKLQEYFAAKNGYLIIDEAFMDLTSDVSLAGEIGTDGLIILRSFGKFFGLAGMRIGFMLAPVEMVAKMQNMLGLWNIAGMALEVATTALKDMKWQAEMRHTLADDMREMHRILQRNGFSIIGSTNLFCLVSIPNEEISAHKYFDKLASHHILTRKFTNDDTILR